ncbi:MAG TPA: membrane protein insertase YidC [Bryobacteraceae bacterium]|nr:membrane protein insertase YidC [Bryobacteraceae bacterium]
MADSVSGGNSPGQPPKDMSMEMRLLLAFLLMGAVMFVTPYFLKTPATPAVKKAPAAAGAVTTSPASTASKASTAAGAPGEATPASAPAPESGEKAAAVAVPGATPQHEEPPVIIDTNLFRVVLSNQGGTVRSWLLKKYKGNDGKTLDLVNTAAGQDFPFSLHFPGTQPTAKVNWADYTQTVDPDGLGVTYAFSDGHTSVRKVFRFQKNSYLSHVSTEASVDGKPVPNLIEWRGGFGDLTLPTAAVTEHTLYFDITNNKLLESSAHAAKNGPVTATGNYSFAGIADTYFAAVVLPPPDAGAMEVVTFADTVRSPLEEKPAAYTGAAMGEVSGAGNHFELFVGPKDLNMLSSINPKLAQLVDFGWFSILAKPLFLLVNWFDSAFIHNFGWSIVIITIAINLALFPLKLSNMKSMRKMQALKPQVDAINDKYRGLKMTDPKKGQQQQEVMDLYKKYGVNPMGGCFPMLIQIPFFYAFYKVFTISVEMRGASWLWVTDLSQPEHLAIHILPLIMIATQYYMQKMTPQGNVDPNQQKMMMFMPLIFGFMFYNLSSGLVLYYLTSNLVGVGQQLFFNHTQAAIDAARSVEPPKKKNGRK